MPYEFYKVLHIFGNLLLFVSLGGLAMLVLRGGSPEEVKPLRKYVAMTHGLALLVVFVAGFGLMARLNMMGMSWPLWIYVKIAVWLVLGAAIALIARLPALGKGWYFILPLLGGLAAYMAVYKPN